MVAAEPPEPGMFITMEEKLSPMAQETTVAVVKITKR